MTTNDDAVHGTGFTSASLSISGGAPLSGTATIFHLDGERFGEMHDLVELAISDGGPRGSNRHARSPRVLRSPSVSRLPALSPVAVKSFSAMPVAKDGGSEFGWPRRPETVRPQQDLLIGSRSSGPASFNIRSI